MSGEYEPQSRPDLYYWQQDPEQFVANGIKEPTDVSILDSVLDVAFSDIHVNGSYEMSEEDRERLIGHLDEQERNVLRLRFGLDRGEPRTYEEVADELSLLPEAVRSIENRALIKFRKPIQD